MSTDSEHSVLILGIGSPFGADRVGWEAIDLLRRAKLPGVRLETSDRPGARLLAMFDGVDHAILIDALAGDAAPGKPVRVEFDRLAAGDRVSNHGFGVADALALGRVLGALPSHLTVIGIGAEGDESPAIDSGALVAMVRAILEQAD